MAAKAAVAAKAALNEGATPLGDSRRIGGTADIGAPGKKMCCERRGSRWIEGGMSDGEISDGERNDCEIIDGERSDGPTTAKTLPPRT